MLAFSAFEATFACSPIDRFDLGLSSTAAVFTVIGIAFVIVQGGSRRTRSTSGWARREHCGLALLANGVGLIVLALDAGWLGLVRGARTARASGRA